METQIANPGGAPQLRKEKTARVHWQPEAGGVLPRPVLLQRRAHHVLRKHASRALVRWTTLLATDVIVLAVARLAIRGVGDARLLGDAPAHVVRTLVPRGSFPTWELTIAVLIGLLVFGTYGEGDRRRDPATIMAGSTLGLSLLAWEPFWNGVSPWFLGGFVLSALSLGLALVLARHVVDRLEARIRSADVRLPCALLVGPAAEARRVLESPAVRLPAPVRTIGYVDLGHRPAADALGGIDDLTAVIHEQHVETIVLCGDGGMDDDALRHILHTAEAAGCEMIVLPRLFDYGVLEPSVVWRDGTPMVHLTRPAVRWQHLVLKRVFDIAASVIGLIVFSPIMLAAAIAVRVSSPGPVLFRQQRIGRGGQPFTIYKFRSMVQDAEARRAELTGLSVYADGRLFKIRRDPRVTPVGRFLRRTSIDELPQLWNVLRGDMSLVGPRPPLPSEVALYEEHHYSRFEMKPGITGPWQASGRNNLTDFDEIVRLEVAYFRHWSIWRDFDILLRTLPIVLRMEGAH